MIGAIGWKSAGDSTIGMNLPKVAMGSESEPINTVVAHWAPVNAWVPAKLPPKVTRRNCTMTVATITPIKIAFLCNPLKIRQSSNKDLALNSLKICCKRVCEKKRYSAKHEWSHLAEHKCIENNTVMFFGAFLHVHHVRGPIEKDEQHR